MLKKNIVSANAIKSWIDGLFKTQSPSLKLLSHYEENTFTVIVVKNSKGSISTQRLNQNARSPLFIQQFCARDAHLLGYLLGYEDMLMTLRCVETLAN